MACLGGDAVDVKCLCDMLGMGLTPACRSSVVGLTALGFDSHILTSLPVPGFPPLSLEISAHENHIVMRDFCF